MTCLWLAEACVEKLYEAASSRRLGSEGRRAVSQVLGRFEGSATRVGSETEIWKLVQKLIWSEDEDEQDEFHQRFLSDPRIVFATTDLEELHREDMAERNTSQDAVDEKGQALGCSIGGSFYQAGQRQLNSWRVDPQVDHIQPISCRVISITEAPLQSIDSPVHAFESVHVDNGVQTVQCRDRR